MRPGDAGTTADRGPDLSIASTIGVMLTRVCSLRCPYCFAVDELETSGHMSPEAFAGVLAFFDRHRGLKAVALAGGEPTMNPAFEEILDLARQREGVTVHLLTNGIFDVPTREALGRFEPHRLGLLINVNDPRRVGAARFATIEENLAALAHYPVTLGINFYDASTPHEHVVDLARRHGCDLRWSVAHPVGGAPVYVTPEMFPEVRTTIRAFLASARAAGVHAAVDCGASLCIFEDQEIAADRYQLLRDNRFVCDPPVVVDPDSNVFFCFEGHETRRQLTSFADLGQLAGWLWSKLQTKGQYYWLEACEGCSYAERKLCGGGCPHHASRAPGER